MALVWQSEMSLLCQGCGQPADETTDPAAEGAYDTHKIVCHACAARDRRAAESQSTDGVYYTVERRW